MNVAIIGHKDKKIKKQEEEIKIWLKEQLINLKACYKNIFLEIGTAKGIDQIAIQIVNSLCLPFKYYFIPYQEKDNQLENLVAAVADEIDWGYNKYSGKRAYFERDCCMIDDCDIVLFIWDGLFEGRVYKAYQYAQEKGKQILVYAWKK